MARSQYEGLRKELDDFIKSMQVHVITESYSFAYYIQEFKKFSQHQNELTLLENKVNLLIAHKEKLTTFNDAYHKVNFTIRDNYFNEKKCNITTLRPVEKNTIHVAYRYLSAKTYGLKVSGWHPEQGFDGLFHVLKIESGLYVNGYFDSNNYQSKAVALNYKIQGREVYAWAPGSYRYTEDHRLGGDTHAILIVGVQEVEEEGDVYQYVYYLDPNDDDPAEEGGILRVMSYASFVCRLVDMTALNIDRADMKTEELAVKRFTSRDIAFFSPFKMKYADEKAPPVFNTFKNHSINCPRNTEVEHPANYLNFLQKISISTVQLFNITCRP